MKLQPHAADDLYALGEVLTGMKDAISRHEAILNSLTTPPLQLPPSSIVNLVGTITVPLDGQMHYCDTWTTVPADWSPTRINGHPAVSPPVAFQGTVHVLFLPTSIVGTGSVVPSLNDVPLVALSAASIAAEVSSTNPLRISMQGTSDDDGVFGYQILVSIAVTAWKWIAQ